MENVVKTYTLTEIDLAKGFANFMRMTPYNSKQRVTLIDGLLISLHSLKESVGQLLMDADEKRSFNELAHAKEQDELTRARYMELNGLITEEQKNSLTVARTLISDLEREASKRVIMTEEKFSNFLDYSIETGITIIKDNYGVPLSHPLVNQEFITSASLWTKEQVYSSTSDKHLLTLGKVQITRSQKVLEMVLKN